jgi:hypothetical protein
MGAGQSDALRMANGHRQFHAEVFESKLMIGELVFEDLRPPRSLGPRPRCLP